MLYVVIGFLWCSILLYLLMGGADFGAGIIELFTSRKNERVTRRTLYRAIGPIWEANHMWLIITIVILFVGFPSIYSIISVHLHLPLLVMLLGIIARGTAFTFRHYDAVVDDMQGLYNRIFTISSLVTPFFLGVIAASAVSGRIDTNAIRFADAYIFSWLNFFSLAVGAFTVSTCGFLASVYLVGEVGDEAFPRHFIKKVYHLSTAAVACGALVFIASVVEDIPLGRWLFGNSVSFTAICFAGISLLVLWYLLRQGKTRMIRVLAGFQITMLLLATTYAHYPQIVLLRNKQALSLLDEQAHPKTIHSLGWALILGSVFILPALGYLLYSFQKKANTQPAGTKG